MKNNVKINFYNIFWSFILFGILGFLVEQTAEFVAFGDFSSRKGMLYGPFSQIWGLGATIAVLLFNKLKEKNYITLFLICAALGGIYEYFASLIQELLFGTISWQYSYIKFNFQGRTNILFCIYWGIAGVIIIKAIYPFLCQMLSKIPHKKLKIITIIVFILISIDAILTTAAVIRYNERHLNIPAKTKFQMFIDEKYPDSFMKKVYPKTYFTN